MSFDPKRRRNLRNPLTGILSAERLVDELRRLPADTPISICGANEAFIHVDVDDHNNVIGATLDHDTLDDAYPDIEDETEDEKTIQIPSFEDLFPNTKTGDKIKMYSLLCTEHAEPCVICGKPTRFVEWCTESRLCGTECYRKHFDMINKICNDFDAEEDTDGTEQMSE